MVVGLQAGQSRPVLPRCLLVSKPVFSHVYYNTDFEFRTVMTFSSLSFFHKKCTPKVVSNFWGALQVLPFGAIFLRKRRMVYVKA